MSGEFAIDISVVIISYNTADLIERCLDSILDQEGVTLEVVVVDNDSTDNSEEVLKSYGDKIHFVQSGSNLGFGRAINMAVKSISGKYVYMFNPDAYLTDSLSLKTLSDYMTNNLDVGLAGSTLYNDNKKESYKTKYPAQNMLTTKLQDLPGDIAWVVGASMIMPSKLFREINGFDEDFFLDGEEVDLCMRVRKSGFKIGFCDAVSVYHLVGGSERKTCEYKRRCKGYKARFLFCKKHYSKKDFVKIVEETARIAKRARLINSLLYFVFRRPRHYKVLQKSRAIIDTARAALSGDW